MIRAFLAVELDDGLRDRIAGLQRDLRRQIEQAEAPGGRRSRISWTSPSTMHLTLKFFGDIADAMTDPIRQAIAPLAAQLRPTTLPLVRLGVFPGARDPRVLWIGPSETWAASEPAAAVRALHRGIEDACGSLGLHGEDRPFNPHLTIARVRSIEPGVSRVLIAAASHPQNCGDVAIDRLTFFSSRLGGDGATHTPLWQLRLGAV